MKSIVTVLVSACLGAVAGFVFGQQLGGKAPLGTPLKPAQVARNDASALPPGSDQIYKVALGDAPIRGKTDAKVTLVEWSDFQCPFCGRAFDTLRQVEKLYGDEVRIAFKQNPLPMHPDAPFAAKASIAAGKQGKFWEMHDKLFEANNSHQPDALQRSKVEAMARSLGLDMAQFARDADAKETADQIAADQAQAAQFGATGTPVFFVNGSRIPGAYPLETFKAVIDAQLKRADKALASGTPRAELYAALTRDGLAGQAPQPAQQPAATARAVELGDGPVLGGKRAKVTIVEWSDFQCPFCGRVEPTLQQIRKTYGDDVRLVWRNQPLSFHPNAMPAAKAAMAAARQGKFWPMHDRMFEHQSELSEAKYEEWAKEIGLDLSRWRRDKESPGIAAAIAKDIAEGNKAGADGTPTFFIDGKVIQGAVPFEQFKAVIDEQLARANDALKRGVKHDRLYDVLVAENVKAAPAPSPAPAAGPGAPAPDAVVAIEAGDAPSRGGKNAPVSIIIFSDFQCPFCARAEPTLKQVADTYGSRVKFVWKNEPLPFHPNAMPAAEAAMAAYEQGNDKFWAMHDKLFAQQAQLGPELYEKIAGEIGLDLNRFKASLAAHKAAASIQADMALANSVGANGTPTFFINGHRLVGAQPFEAFKAKIDEQLAAAGKVAKK